MSQVKIFASFSYYENGQLNSVKGSKSSIAVPSYGLGEVNALVFSARVGRTAATSEQ